MNVNRPSRQEVSHLEGSTLSTVNGYLSGRKVAKVERRHSFSPFPMPTQSLEGKQKRRYSQGDLSKHGKVIQQLKKSQKKDDKTLQEVRKLKKDFNAFMDTYDENVEEANTLFNALQQELQQILSGNESPVDDSNKNSQIDVRASTAETAILREMQTTLENVNKNVEALLQPSQQIEQKPHQYKNITKPQTPNREPTYFERVAKAAANVALPLLVGGVLLGGALFLLSKKS